MEYFKREMWISLVGVVTAVTSAITGAVVSLEEETVKEAIVRESLKFVSEFLVDQQFTFLSVWGIPNFHLLLSNLITPKVDLSPEAFS